MSIFHYTFAVREETQKLAVRFGEEDYELRQVSCRVGLVDETKNAALYKNPADLKLSASGNGYAGEVQAETDQWMITSIPFDDSLKIYVDGTQVETVRVNGGFAGARVSKGAHRIELRYQAPGSRIGLGLSAAAAITGGIWVILSRKTSIPQHGGARSKQSAGILTGSAGSGNISAALILEKESC